MTMGFVRRIFGVGGLAASALLAACGGNAPPVVVAPAPHGPGPVEGPAGPHEARTTTIRVQVNEGNALVVRTVALDDYVAASILSEFDPPEADRDVVERMYEVQAVVSRTYALSQRGRHAAEGFDVCSTTHCQLYDPARLRASKWADLAREATVRTAGEVLWFADAPAQAVFHADCGGQRSSAFAVWGGSAPAYLAGGLDDGPAADAHRQWTFDETLVAVRDALNADPRTRVGGTLDQIQVVERDAAGRAERVALKGTRDVVVRGEVLRDVLTRAFGVTSVRSTLFLVTPVRGRLVLSGKGFGHGVGLCQAGAFARLRAGATPETVLAFYYPGTRLRR